MICSRILKIEQKDEMDGLGPPTQLSFLAMRLLEDFRNGTIGRSQDAIDAAAQMS